MYRSTCVYVSHVQGGVDVCVGPRVCTWVHVWGSTCVSRSLLGKTDRTEEPRHTEPREGPGVGTTGGPRSPWDMPTCFEGPQNVSPPSEEGWKIQDCRNRT